MKNHLWLILAFILVVGLAGHSQAQINMSAETAGPTGVPGNVMGHMADVLAEKKIAN